MRTRALIAPVLLAALVLTACGSESKDAQREERDQGEIEVVANRFGTAVAAKDAKAFCRLLSPRDREVLRAEGRRCMVVWGADRNPLFAAKNPDLEIEEVSELGVAHASAELANGGRLEFVREGNSWYVNLAPAKEGNDE